MSKKDARPDPSDASQEHASTAAELALRHTLHKIAWSRMNGSNEALNPFADDLSPPSSGSQPRKDRHRRG